MVLNGNRPFRILCIGDYPPLLEARCEILARQGYEAVPATLPSAYEQLAGSDFDLVIAGEYLADRQGEAFDAAVPIGTCVLLLPDLTSPAQFIADVAACSSQRAEDPACCPLVV